MKVLLDENIPERLKNELAEFNVVTIKDLGWNGKKNGELMKLILENEFTIFVTFDRNLQYQQNFKKYPISIIVLKPFSSEYHDLLHLVHPLKLLINTGVPIGATTLTF